jgi:cellulose synthase/poly-beta-1,6-N-acetylglucosamine synthase-like glycosyltransferase
MRPAAVVLNTIPVVIPALNEAATIGDVVRSLQAVGLFRICVMDHGSCDRTIAIARPAGAEGVVEPIECIPLQLFLLWWVWFMAVRQSKSTALQSQET